MTDRPLAAVPTPRDVRTAVVADLPMRHDEPTSTGDTGPTSFSVEVIGPDGKGHTVAGVASWRIHDGALSLYGPLPDAKIAKLRTISAFEWTEVRRVVTGGDHA